MVRWRCLFEWRECTGLADMHVAPDGRHDEDAEALDLQGYSREAGCNMNVYEGAEGNHAFEMLEGTKKGSREPRWR